MAGDGGGSDIGLSGDTGGGKGGGSGPLGDLFGSGGGGDVAIQPSGLDALSMGGGASNLGPVDTGGAATASPWVMDSPIQSNSFDYLNAGGTSDPGNIAPGAGFTTSDASLNTGGAGPSTAPATGAGPSFSDWTAGIGGGATPVAAGGTTVAAGPGLTPDVAGGSGGQSFMTAPTAGAGAASIAPTGAGAAAGAPADATSSWTDMLKKGLTSNPLGTAISAAGLGYNILQGQKSTANQSALTDAASKAAGTSDKLATAGIAQVGTNQANAAEIATKGKDLEQYLTTGQLPAQYTQQIDQAINDAKTTAISNAAKNGQPTDPTKNTALAQSLAQIDNQRAGMTSKIAETLFNAGAGLTNTAANVGNASASSLLSGGQSAANLSGSLYTTLTGIDSKQSEQTAKAIAALASSLNSGGSQKKAA